MMIPVTVRYNLESVPTLLSIPVKLNVSLTRMTASISSEAQKL